MTDEINADEEYEKIAKQYVEHAREIAKIVMPKLEKRAILTARRITLKAVKDELLVYKVASGVYNCDIPEDLCSSICGLETCCKDCEVALLVKGNASQNTKSSANSS